MAGPKIQTPRGAIIITPGGKAELKWNAGFQKKWQERFDNAQQFLDSEIIRTTEPFTPMRTGMLVKSGTLGSEFGSGIIKWITPYARRQYYAKRAPGSETGPLRGPQWFSRAKAIYLKVWTKGVELFIKGKK